MAVLVFHAAPVLAAPTFWDSLEWLTDSSKHIALAEVAALLDSDRDGVDMGHQCLGAKTTKLLKGDPPAFLRFAIFVMWDATKWEERDPLDPSVSVGDEFLLFFGDDDSVSYAIDLISPTRRDPGAAFTKDFVALENRADIVAAVEKRMEQFRKEKKDGINAAEGFYLEIPANSSMWKYVESFGTTYLRVPLDRHLRERLVLLLHSEDVYTRAMACRGLARYRSQETVDLLVSLLEDEGTDEIRGFRGGRPFQKKIFPVRQAAYLSLRDLGVDVPEPAGVDELTHGLLSLDPSGDDFDNNPFRSSHWHAPVEE